MIQSLRLTNFKNFNDAALHLGRLTLLVGANASGKSNLRDAFRFLHALGQGYTLAEILGEKYVEGGALLVELIEHSVAAEKLQVVGTTHSPHLLAMLSDKARENAHLVYRLEGSTEGRIQRIMDMPDVRRLLKTQGLARLFESGWLEDTVAFAETAETSK